MESGKFFGFYLPLLTHLRFSPRTLFAPNTGFVVMRPVIVPGTYQEVPAGDLYRSMQVMFSFTSHCAASDCEVKKNWSARKKRGPPIRFATTAATICPMDARMIPDPQG